MNFGTNAGCRLNTEFGDFPYQIVSNHITFITTICHTPYHNVTWFFFVVKQRCTSLIPLKIIMNIFDSFEVGPVILLSGKCTLM
jgi:hypothetical protein